MPIPERIQIGTYTYRVCRDHRIDRDYAGLHWRNRQLIELLPDQGPDSMRATLVHEVLHGVLHNAGVDHESEEGRKRVEAFLDAVTPGLLGVIRDNPDLIDYLRERE